MELAPVTKKIVAFGSKQVFLPKFTIALIRTPNLSPYHAKFLVPLNFSKYDLRDYLYHAYNVKVHSIRSLVKQMPVRDTATHRRHWFRPESEKYMTVMLESPFEWPESPKDWEPWGRKEKLDFEREGAKGQGVVTETDQRVAAGSMRQQALSVLGLSKYAKRKQETGSKKAAPKHSTKKAASEPKKTLVQNWEGRRTPQMLNPKILEATGPASSVASKN